LAAVIFVRHPNTYTDDGQQKTIIDRRGLKREWLYDAFGRLITENWYALNGIDVVETLSYTYSPEGYLQSAANAAGLDCGSGRLVRESFPLSGSVVEYNRSEIVAREIRGRM
jgi:YD repeat-containing protein